MNLPITYEYIATQIASGKPIRIELNPGSASSEVIANLMTKIMEIGDSMGVDLSCDVEPGRIVTFKSQPPEPQLHFQITTGDQ